MAHAATLARLADGLVTAVTGKTADNPAFHVLKENAIKGLRDQSRARTNQYAVKDRLNGVIEKFSVLAREDLSEALESRLAQLPTTSGWMPEILALLLDLSDQPTTNTSLIDVVNANQAHQSTEQLTWEDNIPEDLVDDTSIWELIERGYHSSEDDYLDEETETTVSTAAIAVSEISPADIARLHLHAVGDGTLAAVRDVHHLWENDPHDKQFLQLPEIFIVRDMVSMLRGLPTDIFQKDMATGKVAVTRKVYISTASRAALSSILNSAADDGTSLNSLRLWTAELQDVSYIQTIQASVRQLLAVFERDIGRIEQELISPSLDIVMSIVNVQTRAHAEARILLHLSSLVRSSPSVEALPFGLLDALEESVSISQLAGETTMYSTLRDIFYSSFVTYLRAVHSWITLGSIDTHERDTFFIKNVNEECSRGDVWHGRFEMRTLKYIPNCMHAAASHVFSIGKSQSFIQTLNPLEAFSDVLLEVTLDLSTVDEDSDLQGLLPFTELLKNAIYSWLTEVTAERPYSLATKILQDHGLRHLMTAIPGLYLSRDGSQFSAFTNSLVEQLNKNLTKPSGDQFLLSELAHETLGVLPGVESECIYIEITENHSQYSVPGRIGLLGQVSLRYSLPWPIQNITRSSVPEMHAKVMSFLLQLQHSYSTLSQFIFDLRTVQHSMGEIMKLRQRLQYFVMILQSYIVLAANTIHEDARRRMEAADEIDTMVTIWNEYEKRLQYSLLLAPELDPLHQSVIRLLVLGEVVSTNLQPKRARSLRDQCNKEVRFLAAGLRSISRVGGQALEALAERMEWSLTIN